MYSGIRAAQFPFTCPYMVWFLSLTDCQPGQHKLKISMGQSPESLEQLLERPFDCQDPIQRINLINEVSNLSFPKPGEYTIQIEVDEELLLLTSILISD